MLFLIPIPELQQLPDGLMVRDNVFEAVLSLLSVRSILIPKVAGVEGVPQMQGVVVLHVRVTEPAVQLSEVNKDRPAGNSVIFHL